MIQAYTAIPSAVLWYAPSNVLSVLIAVIADKAQSRRITCISCHADNARSKPAWTDSRLARSSVNSSISLVVKLVLLCPWYVCRDRCESSRVAVCPYPSGRLQLLSVARGAESVLCAKAAADVAAISPPLSSDAVAIAAAYPDGRLAYSQAGQLQLAQDVQRPWRS